MIYRLPKPQVLTRDLAISNKLSKTKSGWSGNLFSSPSLYLPVLTNPPSSPAF